MADDKELEKNAVELNEAELEDVSGGLFYPTLSEEKEDSLEQGVLSREKLTYY